MKRRFARRPAARLSAVAIGGLVASAAIIALRTGPAAGTAALIAVPAAVIGSAGMVLGLRAMFASAICLLVVAQFLQLVANTAEAWLFAGGVGALLFMVSEAGCEALERRDGTRRTADAWRVWLLARAEIVVATAAVTALGLLFASEAPVRSLPVQGLVVAVVVTGLGVGASRWRPRNHG